MILGLLAGATEVNAAKVGVRQGCKLLIVENNSKKQNGQDDTDYVAIPRFVACNDAAGSDWRADGLKPGEQKTYCIEPGTTVFIDRLRTNKGNYRNSADRVAVDRPTPKGYPIDEGLHFICTGPKNAATCRHNPVSDAEKAEDAKLPVEKRCVSTDK